MDIKYYSIEVNNDIINEDNTLKLFKENNIIIEFYNKISFVNKNIYYVKDNANNIDSIRDMNGILYIKKKNRSAGLTLEEFNNLGMISK
jgi:hypothetical protein